MPLTLFTLLELNEAMVKLNDIGKDYSNTCDSCYLDSKEEVGMLFDQLEANLQGLIE